MALVAVYEQKFAGSKLKSVLAIVAALGLMAPIALKGAIVYWGKAVF